MSPEKDVETDVGEDKRVHGPPDFPHGDRVMAAAGEGKEKTPSKAPPWDHLSWPRLTASQGSLMAQVVRV